MVAQIEELIHQVYIVKLNESRALLFQREAELKSLQSQITPHFPYNTLNSISWVASRKGVREIERIVHSLSNMLRYSLGNSSKFVKVNDELYDVAQYFDIVNFRFGGTIRLHMDLPEHLHDVRLPRLSIQPIVENAVEYAFEHGNRQEKIMIRVRDIDGIVEIEIEDNGTGILAEELAKINQKLDRLVLNRSMETEAAGKNGKPTIGMGLLNVHQRLRLRFGEPYGIQVQSAPNRGTVVRLRIPADICLEKQRDNSRM